VSLKDLEINPCLLADATDSNRVDNSGISHLLFCFSPCCSAVNLVFCWMHAYEIEFHMFSCLYSVKFHFRVTFSSALDCWLVSLGNGKTQGGREGTGMLF